MDTNERGKGRDGGSATGDGGSEHGDKGESPQAGKTAAAGSPGASSPPPVS